MSHVFQALWLGVAGVEAAMCARRWQQRRDLFAKARARATALGRPLLVVGAPGNGAATRLLPAYGCGDVCVDLTGCDGCPVAYAADLTRGNVGGLGPDSAVVFVACVLEYVGDVQAAYREVRRIAGSPDNLFVVPVEPWTLTSTLYPHARWAVRCAPPACPTLAVRPVTTTQKVLVGTGVAALTAGAIYETWANARAAPAR